MMSLFIVDNLAIRNISNLQNIWNFLPCCFVTLLSIAFNYHFNGLNVFGYHLFNLAVHLVSAILVWWLVILTLSTPAMKDPAYGGAGNKITQHANLIALFAGLVFVSHPVQIEAVTYIWQRAASMAALFYLASLCFYVKSRCRGGREGRPYYILSLITAIMAMFTKENTITLPLMILLYEFYFFEVGETLAVARTALNWSSYRTLVVTRRYLLPFLLTLFIIPVTMLFTHNKSINF